VAIGNFPSGSKSSVLVPTQRHFPFGCGVNLIGTTEAASSCELNATIGCEKVTLKFAASSTSPEGE
jgi:hypothetical protein